MGQLLTLPTRRAVIRHLKGVTAVTDKVAERLFSKVPPAGTAWPYLRYGAATARPFLGTGLDGNEIDITLHYFAEGETDDACHAGCGVVVKALDHATLPLPDADDPAKLSLRWTDTQVLSDIAKVDGWHGVMRFVGTVRA